MATLSRTWLVLVIVYSSLAAARIPKGLVENEKGLNRSLLVGVPEDLPGIDLDLDAMERLVTLPLHGYLPARLWEKAATADNILAAVQKLAAKVTADGSFLFYYSGHGDKGTIEVYDRSLAIEEIRDAFIRARKGKGPLARLVLIFDSCYSGSLLNPLDSTATLADAVVRQFDSSRSRYWDKLLVLASSKADELSEPSEEGSIYTLALAKAFNEVASRKGKIGEWVNLTKNYTEGQEPVARLVPEELETESLIN
jgi:hypothetical protein